jgi:methionine synthase II (cobalamin-independent)
MATQFRADDIGCLLRPPELLEARRECADGRIALDHFSTTGDAYYFFLVLAR